MRPGIPVIWGWIWPRRAESFNEAQAMRPGIHHLPAGPAAGRFQGFNEAQAMRPGIQELNGFDWWTMDLLQ